MSRPNLELKRLSIKPERFQQHQRSEQNQPAHGATYGDAEGLAVARNISVDGVVRAGILRAAAGKAQLLRRQQLDDTWDLSQDDRHCAWEAMLQQPDNERARISFID